ncbi:MAG TPA: trehalase family glycosidase [Candidatus Limnocylindrales bacterium]|nr:trehalase family glycosidase [Candidatus Limnocylindrales bacterium]
MPYSVPTEQLHTFILDNHKFDGKILADSEPRCPVADIAARYVVAGSALDFSWDDFYKQHFIEPELPAEGVKAKPGIAIDEHIDAMWQKLTLPASTDGYTRIGLPNPTVVPGERFSESYYWDSYFTMRGLAVAGKWDMVEGMVNNFAYQIDQFGYVPNGARFYYLGRSQPPVFSHMVRLLAERPDEHASGSPLEQTSYKETMTKYLRHMRKEHEFWTDGRSRIVSGIGGTAVKRMVLMPDGSFLNRYYDSNATPRPESYRKDIELAQDAGIEQPTKPHEFFRYIRAAAESGWDFSGRWCADGRSLKTINTTDIVPIDLNSLLYDLEATIAEASVYAGEPERANFYQKEAERRKAAINKYLWDAQDGFYYDYNHQQGRMNKYPTMAAAFPLHSRIASFDQAAAVATRLQTEFLQSGGYATTLQETPEQWDGENGWSPLHLIAHTALCNYGFDIAAEEGSSRWIGRNKDLFDRTRQCHEKSNVGSVVKAGDGGEYEGQTGFGWTNASLLDLQK